MLSKMIELPLKYVSRSPSWAWLILEEGSAYLKLEKRVELHLNSVEETYEKYKLKTALDTTEKCFRHKKYSDEEQIDKQWELILYGQ